MEAEARTMEYLRENGYPVPAVDHVSDDGTDMILERIDGTTMVVALQRRPWTVRHQGAVLASLHRRLHAIPPPGFLPPAPIGRGDVFLHMDLHPLNVMIGSKGPVVIDWPNAARGDPGVDVGLAWVLMAAGQVPGGRVVAALLGWCRQLLVNSFLAHVDVRPVEDQLREIVAWKVRNPNISAKEQQAMWRLIDNLEAG
jgi:aminoglycoside phosphotransferase (APT) family kinase protein